MSGPRPVPADPPLSPGASSGAVGGVQSAGSPAFQPESFGRYYLVDRVAVGGMAEVFKAKSFSERGFEKLLVIKRILQHLSGNEDFVEMFIDEAKISVELTHPNVVQIYDFGKIRENYFIAMECVEGKDVKGILRKLAERRKVMPPEYAAYIAHEMCKGLDFAHKKTNLKGEPLGIVHRDISPSNILVSYHGDVKVADFGIAKAQISLYNTKDGVLKGKFEYMSPEQASGGKVTFKSDIFATGIILHEMLTGRRLFKTDSEIKTLERVKAADVPLPSSINPSVPAKLEEIAMRALSRDPDHRYTDCKELQQALLEYLYPSSPDIIRESLSHFTAEIFAGEISDERDRLEVGTRLANEMWEQEPEIDLDEDWKEGASAGTPTIQTAPSRLPWVIAVLAVLGMGLVVAVAAAVWLTRDPTPAPKPSPEPVAVAEPTTGTLQLRITPADVAVKVLIGGKVAGSATGSFLSKEIQPGVDLGLRVEAPGYKPYEDAINVPAGEVLRMPVALVKEGEAPAPLKDDKAEKTSVSEKKSETAAAPPPEQAPPPEKREEKKVEEKKAAPAEPGKVAVGMKGWGRVFVDGKDTGKDAPTSLTLPAGTHTIRVVNADAGVDASQSVTVTSGGTVRAQF